MLTKEARNPLEGSRVDLASLIVGTQQQKLDAP